MHSERERAQEMKYTDPVAPDIKGINLLSFYFILFYSISLYSILLFYSVILFTNLKQIHMQTTIRHSRSHLLTCLTLES